MSKHTVSKSEDFFVFPGHPIVVALIIVEQFASLEEAKAPIKDKTKNKALVNNLVYGSDSAIKSAIDILEEIKEGQQLKVVRKLSEDLWEGNLAHGLQYSDVREGNNKADKAYNVLIEALKNRWGWKFV